MTPRRSGSPNARFDIRFPGIGRIRQPVRARTWQEYDRRKAVVYKLFENSQLDILRAFKAGQLTIEQLVDADRQDQSRATLDDLKIRAPLWRTVDETLSKMRGKGQRGTAAWRYRTSWDALRRLNVPGLESDARLSALAAVDWETVKDVWPNSGSDWMHLRRAVSRTLTRYLGHLHHPFRLRVMAQFPAAREKKRKPHLTPDQFKAIVAHTPEHVAPSLWCLVLTGMRLGEYLRVTLSDLDHTDYVDANGDVLHRVHVPGTKTDDADGWISVPAHLWGWIVSGVPARIGEKRLRMHWWAALEAEGVSGVTLHDLRHCHGQWAMDAGADERDVQDSLRHSSPAMTRRYTLKGSTARVASAIGQVFPAPKAKGKQTRGRA